MGYKGTTKWQGKFTLGQNFGDWTVTDSTVIVDHEAKVKCKCVCGTERYVSVLTLVRGISRRCAECGNSTESHSGCKNGNWKGVGVIPGSYFTRLNGRGKLLTEQQKQHISDIFIQQNGRCALTKLPISLYDSTASLDRIDSSKGYVVGNVQWVHKDVNIMKNGYSLEYFVGVCKLVTENNDCRDIRDIKNTFVFGNTNSKKSGKNKK